MIQENYLVLISFYLMHANQKLSPILFPTAFHVEAKEVQVDE